MDRRIRTVTAAAPSTGGGRLLRVRAGSLAAGLTAALTACGGGEAGGPAPETGLDGPDRELALTPEPVFSVGGFDAPEWATFGSVAQVAFDGRGHLYVLDGQTNIVTEIDAQGQFVRTIGRPGEGPGELSNPFALTVTDRGEVAVFDVGHQGWVVYGPDGEYLRNVRLDMGEVGIPGRQLTEHPDGGVVGPIGGRIRFGPGGGGGEDEVPSRPVAYFALAEDDTSRVLYQAWDLPPAPEGDQENLSMGEGRSVQLRMPTLRAFEPEIFAAAVPDGRVAVVDSTGYRIKFVDASGTVVDVLERPIAPTPVTPALAQMEKERRAAEMAENSSGGMTIMVGGSGGGQVDPAAVRRMMEGRLETMIFAEEIPVIERMAADRDGRIWVQRSSGEPGVDGPTDVLTVDGRYLGTIPPTGLRIPDAFGPNGLYVREETDEFDVPTLIVERVPADIR